MIVQVVTEMIKMCPWLHGYDINVSRLIDQKAQ